MNGESSEVIRLQSALEELDRTIQAEGAGSRAYFERGVIHGQLSDPANAVRDFSEAIFLVGSKLDAY